MRAAGGRVAQLIKTPVLMSQPVTPGREQERERVARLELGCTQLAVQTANQPSSQPTRPHVRQALTLCPSPPSSFATDTRLRMYTDEHTCPNPTGCLILFLICVPIHRSERPPSVIGCRPLRKFPFSRKRTKTYF